VYCEIVAVLFGWMIECVQGECGRCGVDGSGDGVLLSFCDVGVGSSCGVGVWCAVLGSGCSIALNNIVDVSICLSFFSKGLD